MNGISKDAIEKTAQLMRIVDAYAFDYAPPAAQSAAPAVQAEPTGEQCDGCSSELGDAYCATCLVDAPAKWLRGIIADGYRTDTERYFAEVLLKLTPPASQSPAAVDLSAFDAAVAAELPCVSVVPYNSHEICKWFAKNVRERLSQSAAHPEGGDA
jgi:hypothetical protein